MRKLLLILAALLIPATVHAQVYQLAPVAHQQFFTNNGQVAAGYKLCTFYAGGTTPQTAYSDNIGTALPDPITLNAAGRPQTGGGTETGLYLSGLSYKFILYAPGTGNTCNGTQVGALLWSQDYISAAASNVPFVNAQSFAGTDTFAKINAAIASTLCTNGCIITDGKALNSSETITSGAISWNVPITLLLHAKYTWSSAAIAGGIIQVNGGSPTGASGSAIICDQANPQNLAYEQVNTIVPCGIIYTPASSSGPAIVLSESGGALNSVLIKGLSLSVNSNVTDAIRLAATGGGMGYIEFSYVSIANSSTTQSWSGKAINLLCTNAGAASGAQYTANFDHVTLTGNGTAINSGAGGTTSTGIVMDPTGGTGCGTFGPSQVNWLVAEGLTGNYVFYAKGAQAVTITNCLCHANNLAANGQAIHLENAGFIPAGEIRDSAFDDNDWSNNGGVIDISYPSGAGLQIINDDFNGGGSGTTHAEDHAIDIGANGLNVVIRSNRFNNLRTYGTVINGGSGPVNYCGNYFTVGNASASEFQTYATLTNRGCMWFNAGTDNILGFLNPSGNNQRWDLDLDVGGIFNLKRAGTTFTYWDSANTLTNNGKLVASSATTNSSVINLIASSGGFSVIDCNKLGSGTILPCQIQVGGSLVSTFLTTASTGEIIANGTSSDISFGVPIISIGPIIAASASTNAQFIELAQNTGSGNVAIATGHSAAGTTKPIEVYYDNTKLWTFNGGGVTTAFPISFATNPALSGFLRMQNNFASAVTARNAANSNDVVLVGVVDNSNNMYLGDSSNGSSLVLRASAGVTVGNATTTTGVFDTLGRVFMQSLNTEGSTKSAVCHDDASFEILTNAAATCTVSSLRFKNWLGDLSCKEAQRIIKAVRPGKFQDKDGSDGPRYGFAAEDMAKIEPRLVYYERDGKTPRAVDYERYTAVLTRVIQCGK